MLISSGRSNPMPPFIASPPAAPSDDNAVAEVDADDPHALDQRLGQHLVGRPATFQQDVDPLHDLISSGAVVKVVMGLLGQLLVIEEPQIEFVITAQWIS